MAAEREPPTLADYAVTAISPMLIMAMVGSLVFFLVEVLYAGKYSDRLLYSLFFFVIGAVLVARIAIQIDGNRAAFYGLGLGIVTFLAMNAYVEYPPGTPLRSVAGLVNLGLMALIWWSAHKLTWDCTHIDENRDASGRGLLAAAGLDADAREEQMVQRESMPSVAEADTADKKPRKKQRQKQKHESQLWNWFGRYRTHRDSQLARGHTPGVWVIYFALAALPLFAIGQSLIEVDDSARRWRSFAQMTVYIASALGLLVTTSLLGLRRYLRQRKVKIPAALTVSWLGLGGVLIVGFLVLGAFLPRPHSEVPWFGLQRAGKSEREASQYAQMSRNSGTGEGADGEQTEKGDGKASGKNGEPGGGKGQNGSGGKGDNGKGGGKDAKTSGEQSQQGREGNNSDQDGDEGKAASEKGSNTGRSSAPQTGVMTAANKIAGFLKWIVIAVVVFLVIVGVVLAVLRYLAPFTNWAKNVLDALRNWWANLFGSKVNAGRGTTEATVPRGPVRPPPFHTFTNPFEDGSAKSREPRELIAYTFAAFDSWAWDRDLGREAMETPLEFAARLGVVDEERKASFHSFALLYVRATYSEAEFPKGTLKQLERFWDELIHGAGFVAVE